MPASYPDEEFGPVIARSPAPPGLDAGWRLVLAALKREAEAAAHVAMSP